MPGDQTPSLPAAPAAPAPVRRHTVEDAFDHDVALRLAFVGVGQGGGRMAEAFWKLGYRRVCAVNTAASDLADLDPAVPRLDLGTGGAGQDPARGFIALSEGKHEVWDLLTRAWGDQADYALVCASLGGGTGSGGVAPLLGTCRRYHEHCGREPRRVGALVSLPNSSYEGQRTCRNAVESFAELHRTGAAPLLVVDNRRVEQLHPVGSTELYPNANRQVAQLLHLFNRLAAQRSRLLTFDPADLAALLDRPGLVTLGAAPVARYDSRADLSEAVRTQLGATVLAEVDLATSQAAGCVFLGGERVMGGVPMDYFGGGFSALERLLADDSTLYRGVYVGETDDLRCYTLVAGLAPPRARLAELARAGRLPPDSAGVAEYLKV